MKNLLENEKEGKKAQGGRRALSRRNVTKKKEKIELK